MKSCKIWSKRQDNWKNYQYLFNQRKNLVFQCSCGKKYLSYPGLYLHYQRKHNQKISTNFEQEFCQIIIQGQKTVYLYKASEKQSRKEQIQKSQTSEIKKNQISNVLSEFMEQFNMLNQDKQKFKQAENKKQFAKEIIQNLQIFIQNILEQKHNSEKKFIQKNDILYQIPNYLNEFMSQISVAYGSKQYWRICKILYQLSQWLRRQGHTTLILQFTTTPPQQF